VSQLFGIKKAIYKVFDFFILFLKKYKTVEDFEKDNNMIMRNTITKTRLVLVVEDKILLMAQTDDNGGKYTLPGGTIKKKEFAQKALIRECKEELGIKLKKKNLQVIHILHKKKLEEDRVSIYFLAEEWKKTIECKEMDKFCKVEWFSIFDLPKNLSPTVKHVLKQIKKGKLYSEISTVKKQKAKRKKLNQLVSLGNRDSEIDNSTVVELPLIIMKSTVQVS